MAFLQAAGYPDTPGASARVSERFRIPRRTIERWAKGERTGAPQHIIQVKRAELRDMLREEATEILVEMAGKREEAGYRDLAIALGIIVDKLQLLSGGPTDSSTSRIVIEYIDVAPDAPAALTVAADGSA
jgi:hypothetical protein